MNIKKRKVNVKALLLSVFVLLFLCNPMILTVSAKPQSDGFIVFGSFVKGQGILSWGLAFYPREPYQEPYTYGEQEYVAVLERGILVVTGFSFHLTYDTEHSLWILEEIRSSGVIIINWHQDTEHRLAIRIKSTSDTGGIYGRMEEYDVLLFGIDTEYLIEDVEGGLDPYNAKMSFRGTLDGEEVTGTIHIALAQYRESTQGPNIVLVNLYINEYNKYVALIWAEFPELDVSIRLRVRLFNDYRLKIIEG
ncbi:MAG: hypothetical protein ACTSR0_00710 [Candidatus Asgardarchaeia archaeon]